MSKIIKASQIIGKYKLSSVHDEQVNEEQNSQEYNQQKQDKEKNDHKSKEEAEKIIKEAEQKAKKIIEEAKKEEEKIEKLKEEAYQKGYKEGKEKGHEEAYQETRDNIEQALNAIYEKTENIKDQYEKELDLLKPQLINIASKMAGKIINEKIKDTPDVINNIVEDVLQDLSNNHQHFVIKVNPEILPYLSKNELKTSFPESDFKFNADENLQKGDCVINTNFGGKDAYLKDKLERLKKQILKEMDLIS